MQLMRWDSNGGAQGSQNFEWGPCPPLRTATDTIQIQDLFYQRSLGVVNRDTDPRYLPPMDAPMGEGGFQSVTYAYEKMYIPVQILGSVNCKKSITDSSSACSDKSQPIFKGIRTPALRQSGMKVKYVTNPRPNPPWRLMLLEARF